MLFVKSTFLIKQPTDGQEGFGEGAWCPSPNCTALETSPRRDKHVICFPSAGALNHVPRNVKTNRLEASVQISDQLGSSSFPGRPALRRFLLASPGKKDDCPPFQLILPNLVGKSH